MVKKIAVIQARLSSSRLPGKVLNDLCGKTLLERVIDQVKRSELIDEIWIATSKEKTDDLIEIIGLALEVKVHRGSLDNVLERFCEIVEKSSADIIVRVTADNPLTEPRFIDSGIREIINNNYDYAYFGDIPYGTGVEVVTKNTLVETMELTSNIDDLEHVTLFIKKNSEKFNIKLLYPDFEVKRSDISLTIDTLEDYVKMFKLFHHFYNDQKKEYITLEDAVTFLDL